MDSICKNHCEPYATLFQKNILFTFSYVFSKSDEKVRGSMYKLRHTWTSAPLFSSKLRDLDIKIRDVDPAWPMLKSYAPAPPASAAMRSAPAAGQRILINPKFTQAQTARSKPTAAASSSGGSSASSLEETTEKMRQ